MENQFESENSLVESIEPEFNDNSVEQYNEYPNPAEMLEEIEGQSQDPSEEMLLGKFKTVEDLSNAYLELQRLQGANSQELGNLRKTAGSYNDLAMKLINSMGVRSDMKNYIDEYRTKYDKPEYFQDSSFRDMYKEAYLALGNNLDTDKFIDLLEKYVVSRISANEKSKSAKAETQKALDSMTYSKNLKNAYTPPKKHFSQMTQAEIDEMLDRLI